MHKNHIRNLSLRSLSVRLSSCYCINGAEALMGGLIWLKHFARLSSFCLSDPSDLCTSFFHITLVVVISPLSCPSPLPLVAFALLLTLFLQPHSSLIAPCPTTSPFSPSLQIFIILPLPPPSPLSSPLFSPTRFVMVHTSLKKIFPLHSNAPPHYCSLCCHWCRRRCRDVKLHQRRLHIASAHSPVVICGWVTTLSLSLADPLTPSASILPTSPLFSSLSPAYLHISPSLSRTTKNK